MSDFLFNTFKQNVKPMVKPMVNQNIKPMVNQNVSFIDRFQKQIEDAKQNIHIHHTSRDCANCDNYIHVKFNMSQSAINNYIDFTVDQKQNLILDGESIAITNFNIIGMSMKEITIKNYNTIRNFKFTISKDVYKMYKTQMQIYFWLKIDDKKYMCKGKYIQNDNLI